MISQSSPLIFVHNSLPIGGAEQLRLAVCRELLRREIPFRICALECASTIGEELMDMGCAVDVLGTKQWISDVRVWWRLLAYLKKHRPAVVQSALFEANTHSRWVASWAKIPLLVCEEHGLDYRRHWWHAKLDELLQQRADVVLTVSHAVYDYMRSSAHIQPEKLQVLHNCIDPQPLQQPDVGSLRDFFGIEPQRMVIGHVGALKEEKGHRLLFQSFQQLMQQGHDIQLLLVGDGPMRVELELYAQELGIADAVTFAGSRRDMQACFQSMDLFAFPSVNEALGIALQEAMWMGLAVVASDQGGMSELIEHGQDGLLVPLHDRAALTAALDGLLKDKRLRQTLGEAAHEKIKRHYLPKVYVDQLFQLYREKYAQKKLARPAWLEE